MKFLQEDDACRQSCKRAVFVSPLLGPAVRRAAGGARRRRAYLDGAGTKCWSWDARSTTGF